MNKQSVFEQQAGDDAMSVNKQSVFEQQPKMVSAAQDGGVEASKGGVSNIANASMNVDLNSKQIESMHHHVQAQQQQSRAAAAARPAGSAPAVIPSDAARATAAATSGTGARRKNKKHSAIRVVCRLRPLNENEKKDKANVLNGPVVEADE